MVVGLARRMTLKSGGFRVEGCGQCFWKHLARLQDDLGETTVPVGQVPALSGGGGSTKLGSPSLDVELYRKLVG